MVLLFASESVDIRGSETSSIEEAAALASATAVMECSARLVVRVARSSRSLRNSSTDLLRSLSDQLTL